LRTSPENPVYHVRGVDCMIWSSGDHAEEWEVRFAHETLGGYVSPHAVIDVGSNTIHLLVGEVEDGAVLPVTGEKVSARLGSGMDETGRIEEARISVAAEAIGLFAKLAALNGASETAVLATSAVRDATNGSKLVERVAETGLEMRLISGEEEALLGFRGAVSALGSDFSWEDRKALVVDLGGGSAQLTLGDAINGLEKQVSLPLGTNRTTERYVGHDPPEAAELEALREAVLEVLPGWELSEGTEVVAIGGSARAILRLTRDRLTQERLKELAEEISRKPSAALAREEGLAPERARVMPAAITTLVAILERYERPHLTVARGGIREGVILTMAETEKNSNGGNQDDDR
jgi:exopolyphosphatase/guanosine-5'-triphosphate,3'-diphosphate pyrophosphatase